MAPRKATAAKLTSKGQMTLPKFVRERLNLKAGDRLDVSLEGERRIVLVPATYHLDDLANALGPPQHRLGSVEEMDEVIRSTAVSRNR